MYTHQQQNAKVNLMFPGYEAVKARLTNAQSIMQTMPNYGKFYSPFDLNVTYKMNKQNSNNNNHRKDAKEAKEK